MAFVKRGDSIPVEGYYVGDTTNEEVCDQCGHTLTVVAIKEYNTNLVCKICDVEDQDAE